MGDEVKFPMPIRAGIMVGRGLSASVVVAKDGGVIGTVTEMSIKRLYKTPGKVHVECALTLEPE